MTDYFQKIVSIVSSYTDAPTKFVEALALHIGDVCLGRFYIIDKSRGKKPNLFILLSSPPGMGRRGEIQKVASFLREDIFRAYSTDPEEEIKAHLLEGGSPEGFADDIINNIKKGLPVSTNATEWGTILSNINRAGYMDGLSSLFCKLFSGESYYGSLSHKGGGKSRFIPGGLYFSMFNGCQSIEQYFEEKNSGTGLIRRLLIFSASGEDMTYWLPPLSDSSEDELKNELKEVGVGIAKLMKRKTIGIVKYSPEVKEKLNLSAFHWDMKARENDSNPYFLYQQSRWEYELKVASILALLNEKEVIELPHYEKAKEIVAGASPNIQKILESTLVPSKMKDPQHHLDIIFNYIKSNKKTINEIKQTMCAYGIRAKSKGNVWSFDEYIETLLNEKKIVKDVSYKSGYRNL